MNLTTTDGIDMKGSNFIYWWQLRGIHEKLALACVAFYLFQTLLPFLFNFPAASFLYWFSLPSSFLGILEKPWTLVSYAFFHASFSHLFFNMVMLYFGGQLFLNLFNAKRFLNVYFLGLITGGLVFLLSYTIFPVFSGNFVYANKLKEGKDIGRSFETIFSQLFKVFTRSKTPLKTAYKRSKSTPSQGVTTAYKEREQQKKTDAILDKISHSGYDSLTKEEKDYLFSSGKS